MSGAPPPSPKSSSINAISLYIYDSGSFLAAGGAVALWSWWSMFDDVRGCSMVFDDPLGRDDVMLRRRVDVDHASHYGMSRRVAS